MRVQTTLTVAAAIVFVVGCLSHDYAPCAERCDHPVPLDGSEWLSVKDAPVTEGGWSGPSQRAADGTSFFVSSVRNPKEVARAIWTTTALGVYDIYANRVLVGDDFLKPGFTHVRKTRRSFTYDITDMINTEEGAVNEFAAEVSAGWWRDKIVHFAGKKSAFRGALQLHFTDGTTAVYGTNAKDWKAAIAGPITHAAIFDGEEYDARIDPWTAVFAEPEINTEFKGEILPSAGAEVTLRRDLAMKKGPYQLKEGEKLVIDFGQNCAAVPEFVFSAKAGTKLTFLPAEMLNDADAGVRGCDGPKGSIYRANLRCPEYGMRVYYTFKGEGVETYHPRFTFFGYRYAELSADGDVYLESVSTIPVTSIKQELEIGSFKTGDASLNQFVSNVYWGMLSNYLSIPTDCPQRNERLGWTADTQVFADAGGYIADTRSFFSKWMRDMRDTQSPKGGFPGVAPLAQYGSGEREMMRVGWSDAGVIVPWKIWRQFGDRKIVDENWTAMEKLLDYQAETKCDMAAIKDECGNYQWADWLSWEKLESCDGGGRPDYCAFTGPWGKRTVRPEALVYWNYLGACYWALNARMMRDMARDTGRDAVKYETMFAEAKDYLKAKFFTGADGMITNIFSDMQTPAVLALQVGLVEGEAKAKTIASLRSNLEKNGNFTGFLGSSWLMDTLCENGMQDIAVNLMLNHRFPSWLYSVDQGATTIWERWNGWTKDKGFGPVGMNSYNHYAYGAVLAWMYRYLAGIAPSVDEPGFKKIVMRPIFDKRFGHIKAEYNSAAGLIRSHWWYEGDKVIWEFTVPSPAVVTLPNRPAKNYNPGSYRIEL